MTISDLLVILKDRLSKFSLSIVDEDFMPHNVSYLRYNSVNKLWLDFPPQKVRVIVGGVETYIFPTDYTVNRDEGYITFLVAHSVTDVIRVDYECKPFSDIDLTSILNSAVKQVRVLSFHTVDAINIAENYSEAIIKRAYTIALRELQFPTTKYFSISVGGRSMDKSTQTANINAMIESNEKELMSDINTVRYFDKTNIIT